LRTKNYIKGETESLELSDMQGVHGLKALRISVNTDLVIDKNSDERIIEQDLKSSGAYLESIKN
jgi:hypothetical protein